MLGREAGNFKSLGDGRVKLPSQEMLESKIERDIQDLLSECPGSSDPVTGSGEPSGMSELVSLADLLHEYLCMITLTARGSGKKRGIMCPSRSALHIVSVHCTSVAGKGTQIDG